MTSNTTWTTGYAGYCSECKEQLEDVVYSIREVDDELDQWKPPTHYEVFVEGDGGGHDEIARFGTREAAEEFISKQQPLGYYCDDCDREVSYDTNWCAKCEIDGYAYHHKLRPNGTLNPCEDQALEQYEEDPYTGRMFDIGDSRGYWHDQLVCEECQRQVDEQNEQSCIQAHEDIRCIKEQLARDI